MFSSFCNKLIFSIIKSTARFMPLSIRLYNAKQFGEKYVASLKLINPYRQRLLCCFIELLGCKKNADISRTNYYILIFWGTTVNF